MERKVKLTVKAVTCVPIIWNNLFRSILNYLHSYYIRDKISMELEHSFCLGICAQYYAKTVEKKNYNIWIQWKNGNVCRVEIQPRFLVIFMDKSKVKKLAQV